MIRSSRIVALVLSVTLALSMLTGCNESSLAQLEEVAKAVSEIKEQTNNLASSIEEEEIAEDDEITLPNVGEVISGFQVTGINDFPKKNGVLVSMEHVKSGAHLLYLANEDVDCGFEAAFRTVSPNDKGIPHVFEHVTLSGSSEYPNSSLWDVANAGTYNTYMNASTSKLCTYYPISSLSDKQLLALAKFYMDGLTDPLALKDSRPLGREAYRFELDDVNGDINVTGAVFNEMEAFNSDIDNITYLESMKEMFKDSNIVYSSGGIRDDIITITIDELKEFYEKYYHPSNMLITLYGKMDYVAFLEMLDKDYLSNYDKEDINVDLGYEPWEGYVEKVVSAPVEEGSVVDNEGRTAYYIALNGLSIYDKTIMTQIADLLNSDASPIRIRMEKEFPNASFYVTCINDVRIPILSFCLVYSNKGDEKKIRSIVEEELTKIIDDGLDENIIEAYVNSKRLSNLMNRDSHSGINMMDSIISEWAYTGDPLAYMEVVKEEDNITRELTADNINNYISKYLINPKQSVALSVIPEPGLYEKELEEFKNKLADMKAAMSEEEINKLIEDTKAFRQWSDEDANEAASFMDKLAVLDVKELPETVEEVILTEEAGDGYQMNISTIEDLGYVYNEIYLDTSSVPVDKLCDLNLLGKLLTSMSTNEYDYNELAVEKEKITNLLSFSGNCYYDYVSRDPIPYFEVSYYTLNDNIDAANDIVREILLNSDFSDVDRLRYLISNEYANTKYTAENDARGFASNIIIASKDERMKYRYQYTSVPYLEYLEELMNLSDEELLVKSNDYKELLDFIINKDGMQVLIVGDEDGVNRQKDAVNSFATDLSAETRQKVDYKKEISAPECEDGVAVITNDSVNYNGLCLASPEEYDFDYNAKNSVISKCITSKIVFNEFRYNIGAYGYQDLHNKSRYIMASYRDPEVKKSFDVFNSIPNRIRSTVFDEDDINQAIMNVYTDYSYPSSRVDACALEFNYKLINAPIKYSEDMLANMEMAKSVTVEDVAGSADKYQEIIDNAVPFSAGNGSKIKASGLFDNVFDILVK